MALAMNKLMKTRVGALRNEKNAEAVSRARVRFAEPEEHPIRLRDFFRGPLRTIEDLRALDKKLDDDIDSNGAFVEFLKSQITSPCHVDGACWVILPALLHRDLAMQLCVNKSGRKVDLTSFKEVWESIFVAVIGSEFVQTPCSDDLNAIQRRLKKWTGTWLLLSKKCGGVPGPVSKRFQKRNSTADKNV